MDLYASFRPGDIVRAVVLALGDGQSYILSTARNDLGVIHAKSLAGVHLEGSQHMHSSPTQSPLRAAERCQPAETTKPPCSPAAYLDTYGVFQACPWCP